MLVYVISANTAECFLNTNYPAKSLKPHRKDFWLDAQKYSQQMEAALEQYILPHIKKYDLLLAFATKEEALLCAEELMHDTHDKSPHKKFAVVTVFIDAEKIKTVSVNDLIRKQLPVQDLKDDFS